MAKKRDFDAFYYGVGMKLDQQSIDAVGEQLEGRLNKVVDGVKNNLKSISNAVEKGTKDIDTKGLVSALVEAQRELNNFNDFDPKKLQGQIASLDNDFKGLKATLGDVAESIKGFKDLSGFISDVSTRLKNIEIVAPRMGKDALKRDMQELLGVITWARQSIEKGLIPNDEVMKSLNRMLNQVKRGFNSIAISKNPLEVFADSSVAKDMTDIVAALQSIGAPVEDLLDGMLGISTQMKDAFKKAGVTEFVTNTTYQIEEFNYLIRESRRELEKYEAELERLPKTKTGMSVLKGSEDAKLLSKFDGADNAEKALDAIIAKIRTYREEVKNLTGEEQVVMYRDLVALTEATEKRLRDNKSQVLRDKWISSFSGDKDLDEVDIDIKTSDHADKLSTHLIERYNAALENVRSVIKEQIDEIKTDISYYQEELDALLVDTADKVKDIKKPGRPEGTTNKKQKKTTNLSDVTGENFTVSPTLKIDEKKWAAQINEVLNEFSNPENKKIKPINLKVNTRTKEIEDNLNTIRSAIEKTLGGTRKSKKKDAQDNQLNSYITSFDRTFNQFMDRLEDAKIRTKDYADNTLKPALQEAFKFRVQVDGLDVKRDISTEVGSFIDTYIANLNASLEDTPIKLKSNIDELIQEIKTKAQNIEVEGTVGLKAGDISITPQNIGDLNVVVNTSGLAQDDTVQRIYDLLAVRKGSSNPARDARIAELKRLIAEKEGTERATLGVIKAKTSAEEKNISTIVERIEAKDEKTKEPKAVPPTKRKEETTVHLDKAEAVAIVKEAIGGFRGKKDEVKAEAYANLEQKVLDAGNVLHKNIGTLSKTERALYDKLIGLKEAADRVTSTIPKEVADTVTPKEGETSFDKQKIYDRLYNSIGDSISSFKDADTGLTWVKEEASKFRATLSNANASAEELFEAEAGLTILLSKWQHKIGNAKASKEFKYDKNITWGRGYKDNWKEYIDANNLLEGLNNFKLASMKDFKEAYGLTDTKGGSRTKTPTRKSATTPEITSEEQLAQYLKNGRAIVDYYVKLAKWAKMLAPIADNASRVITEADFGDEDSIWHNGINWTRGDLEKAGGEIVIDGSITEADLKQFLVDYETSADDEFRAAFKELPSYIKQYRAYKTAGDDAAAANIVEKIGQEAAKWVRGTRVPDETFRVGSRVVEDGLRQEIKNLAVVFVDELGQYTHGANLGKDVVARDNYLGIGDRTQFAKIIKFLEEASATAKRIQFPKNKKGTKDYEQIDIYHPESKKAEDIERYKPDQDRLTISEEAAKNIQKLINAQSDYNKNLEAANSDLEKTIGSLEAANNLLEASGKASQTRNEIKTQSNKAERLAAEIKTLENQLTNPGEAFETIETAMLRKQEELLALQRELSHMPNKTPKDEENRKPIVKAVEKLQSEIESLKGKVNRANRSNVENAAADLIEQETAEIAKLEAGIESRKTQPDVVSGEQRAAELNAKRQELLVRIAKARLDYSRIKPVLSEEQKQRLKAESEEKAKLNAEMATLTKTIEKLEAQSKGKSKDSKEAQDLGTAKERAKEIRKRLTRIETAQKYMLEHREGGLTPERQAKSAALNKELVDLQQQAETLRTEEMTIRQELAPHAEEIKFLADMIDTKKKYITALQKSLKEKAVMPTADDINAQIGARSVELSNAQAEQARLEAQHIIEQQAVQDIVNPIIESLKTTKSQKEARLAEIGDTKDKKLLAEKQQLEAEILNLDKLISNPGEMAQIVSQIKQRIIEAETHIDGISKQLKKANAEFAAMDKGANYTPEVYAKAVKDKPEAKRALELAEAARDEQVEDFKREKLYAQSIIDENAKKGTLKSDEAEALKNTLIDINALNDKFVSGQIKAKEYAEQVTEAYKTMYKIARPKDVELAESDAKRMVDAQTKMVELEQDIAKIEQIVGSKTSGNSIASSSQTQQEEQKTKETSDQLDFERQKTKEVQTQAELFLDLKKITQEHQMGSILGREHGFHISNGSVLDVRAGTVSASSMPQSKDYDTSGHTHPGNDLYSVEDLKGIIARKEFNPNYEKDYLLTPDFVYELKDIQNIFYEVGDLAEHSKEGFGQLLAWFETIDDAEDYRPGEFKKEGLPMDMRAALKDAVLTHYAPMVGLEYSKYQLDPNGNLIEAQNNALSKATLNTALEFLEHLKAEVPDSHEARRQWHIEDQSLRAHLMSDPVYKTLFDQSYSSRALDKENIREDRDVVGTHLQDALDHDWDLGKFLPDLQKFIELTKQLGLNVDGTALQRIIDAMGIEGKKSDAFKNPTQFMDSIKTDLVQYFGRSETMKPDLREKKYYDSLGISYPWEEKYPRRMLDNYQSKSKPSETSSLESLKSELTTLLAERDAEDVDPRFATVEKQNEIIEILKAGIKVNGKITAEKSTIDEATGEGGETKETTTKETKKKVPKIPTVGKVDLQAETINGLSDVNKEWDVYKNYIAAKAQLSRELESAKAKGDAFTPEDADRIRATRDQVLSLGKDIIKTSEAFTDLKTRSQDATSGIKIGVTDVKEDMLSMVHDRAVAEKALISDISFDDEKQRMTAVLTDMQGQTTRITMGYYEMFDAIVTRSDKTTDSVRKIYKAIENEMQRFVEVGNLTNDITGNPELAKTKAFKDYKDSYDKMLNMANTVRKNGTLATEEEKNQLIRLRKETDANYVAFEKMAKAYADFEAKTGGNSVAMNSTQSLEEQMKNYVLKSQEWTKHQRKMIEETWRFNEAQNSASYAVEKNKGQLASMSVIANTSMRRIGQYTEETKKYQSGMEKFMDSLKNKWKEVARYLMTFGSMYRVFAMLRQGITYVKEIDSALTELKKVTDETEESYERFLKTAAKTADKVGSTIKEIVSSTADWARIGYNLQDAATLAESTAVLLNVSEFQSIDEATSALTSTLQAFSYTAEQSMDVVDVLNEVGKLVARR